MLLVYYLSPLSVCSFYPPMVLRPFAQITLIELRNTVLLGALTGFSTLPCIYVALHG